MKIQKFQILHCMCKQTYSLVLNVSALNKILYITAHLKLINEINIKLFFT